MPDLDFVTNRLLRNPKDFAAVFKRYHGNEIANRFDELLTAHLTIAAQFVNQVKDGDTKAAMETRRLWYQNADDIATFLAEINPNNWTKAEWKKMMDEHFMLLERETTQLLNGNYSASIATFDEVENQAIMMANEMSKGIIKQFRL